MADKTITWRDKSNNEAGFEIELCKGATCTNFTKVATVGPNVTIYTFYGLLAATTYRARVRAFNSRGKSRYSNIITFTTDPIPVVEPPPIPPTPTPNPPPPPTPPPPSATSLYVSLAGNDLNPGTIDFPYRTLRTAYGKLSPGYDLFMRGGLWTGTENVFNDLFAPVPSGNATSPINILGYPGETVVIQVPDTVAGLLMTSGQQYLYFSDFILDGINQVTDVTGQLLYLAGGASYNKFTRLEVRNGNNFGCQITGNGGDAKFNQFLSMLVHDNGDPAGANTNGHGYYIGAPDNTVAFGKSYRNKGMGIQINGPSGSDQCSRNKVFSIELYDNGQRASTTAMNLVAAHGTDILLYNIKSYQTDLRSNLIGIYLYTDTVNAMLFNSTITKHRYIGMGCEFYASAPQFINNIAFGNAADFQDNGGTGTPVKSNNLIGINPLFIDGANNNFHLLSSSPAYHAGITLSLVPDDFDGVLRPAGDYTIGAYQ